MSHNHEPSRWRYLRGCPHHACREQNAAYLRDYAAKRREQGLRHPSQEKSYHAAYMREWRSKAQPEERSARPNRRKTAPRRFNP